MEEVKKKKAIFLDVDGPLITARTLRANTSDKVQYNTESVDWHKFVDQTSLKLVLKLAHKYDAVIVIISELRSSSSVLRQLSQLMRKLEVTPDNPSSDIFGVTPRGEHRAAEIQSVIDKNNIGKFVVIDDNAPPLSKLANIRKHLVLIDQNVGFSDMNYRSCEDHLVDDDQVPTPEYFY